MERIGMLWNGRSYLLCWLFVSLRAAVALLAFAVWCWLLSLLHSIPRHFSEMLPIMNECYLII